jgi:o-succinylbenzoate synthase
LNISATYVAYSLNFIRPAGTSRGILSRKACWYILLKDKNERLGLGEVSFIPGLSVEDPEEIEIQIDHICKLINRGELDPSADLPALPGLQFALETALLDLKEGGSRILFPSDFTRGRTGIATNGLIWMGDPAYMKQQIRDKVKSGFRVLKMKVGALELEQELDILRDIREQFSPGELEIRLGANGSWTVEEAPEILQRFSVLGIHSLEQAIAPGQAEAMQILCAESPVPLALDEELIGITSMDKRSWLLEKIRPSYLILKPGLLGGFRFAEEWIRLAEALHIGWWITSALESAVGLNAIAQWTGSLDVGIPQGLGLGSLYSNNISSPLEMRKDRLWYRPEKEWKLQLIPGL